MVYNASSQVKKNPDKRTIKPFIPVRRRPMLKELLREIIIAIISNPPEVPEYLRISPIPIPPIAPPNTVDNRILSVTATTGTRNKKVETEATQIIVLMVIVFPSL